MIKSQYNYKKRLEEYSKKYFEFFNALVLEILEQEEKLKDHLIKEAPYIIERQYADCAGADISWKEKILLPGEEERIEKEVEDKLSNYLSKFTAEDIRQLIFEEMED